MRFKTFQEIATKYGLATGLEEQASKSEWETALKELLNQKRSELGRNRNPSFARKIQGDCADLEEAVRMSAQLGFFTKLQGCIQEDNQEAFEFEFRKATRDGTLPTEEDPLYPDYLGVRNNARKKWPTVFDPKTTPPPAVPVTPPPPQPPPPPAPPIATPPPPPRISDEPVKPSVAPPVPPSSSRTQFVREAPTERRAAMGQPPPSTPSLLLFKPASGPEIWICSKPQARIGRARDCEFVARVLGPDGRESRQPSLRLSRYHACVEWQESVPVLQDRGYYADEGRWRPSASGIWVDGRQIASGGSQALPRGRDYVISLGSATGKEPEAFCLQARTYALREIRSLKMECLTSLNAQPDEVACLILRTMPPHSPKVFVLLRRAFWFGWIDARSSSTCLCCQGTGLRLCGEGEPAWVVPGRKCRVGNMEFRVLDPQSASPRTSPP